MLENKKATQKRLKSKITQETSCTSEENTERSMHLNVRPPKREKQFEMRDEASKIDIRGSGESTFRSKGNPTLRLMDIPMLTKRKEEPSIFDTRHCDAITHEVLKKAQSKKELNF
jgi:hypothetical protein